MSDTAKIKEVRTRTGIGFGDCKRALVETDWNVESAIEFLRKQSAVKAAKKSDRTAAEGRLALRVADDGKKAAIVEINVESDFAARNEKFQSFCEEVVDSVLNEGPEVIEALNSQREQLVQAIGENVSIRRADRLATDDGLVVGYLHTNDLVGTIVEVSGAEETLAAVGSDVAMHATAMAPMVLDTDDIPEDVLDKERAFLIEQAEGTGRPANIIEKMVEGRLRKFRSENCLLDQEFVRDSKSTVRQMLKQANVTCHGFVRYEVGEGIEKRADDFVAEVEKLAT